MAYLYSIKDRCQIAGCVARASEELRTWRNERFGLYCGRHAKAALARLQADEDRSRGEVLS